MNNFNFSVIEGNLKEDPKFFEHHVTENNRAQFIITTSRTYRNSSGKQVDSQVDFNVIVWGMLACNCAKYLKRGSRVLVSGNMLAPVDGVNSIEAKELNFLTA